MKHINRILLILFLSLGLVACGSREKKQKIEANVPNKPVQHKVIQNPEPAHTVKDIDKYLAKLQVLAKEDPDYAYVYENRTLLSDKFIRLAVLRREALPYVTGCLKDRPDLAPLSSDFPLDSPLPYYLQWDRRWGYVPYANGLIGTYGCAPTSLAMVLTGLGVQASPKDMGQFIKETGNIQDGYTSWSAFEALEEAYPVRVEDSNLWAIRSSFARGGFGILSLGPGDFTTDAHMVALAGLDGEGKYIINDPNSYENSKRHWTYEELKGQVKHVWYLERKG